MWTGRLDGRWRSRWALYKAELIEPKKRLTILQHCYKEPWVPIGCLTTVSVLSVGFYGFISGNRTLMQNMMRVRVVAQGLTVMSMAVGAAYVASQPS